MVNILTKLASPSLGSKASFKIRIAEMRSRLIKRQHLHQQEQVNSKKQQPMTKPRPDMDVDSGLVDSELFLTTTAANDSIISIEMMPVFSNQPTLISSSRTSTPIFDKNSQRKSSHKIRTLKKDCHTRDKLSKLSVSSTKGQDLNYLSLRKNNAYNYGTGVLISGADLFYGDELSRFQDFGALKVWLI